jgi:hypothetical protein
MWHVQPGGGVSGDGGIARVIGNRQRKRRAASHCAATLWPPTTERAGRLGHRALAKPAPAGDRMLTMPQTATIQPTPQALSSMTPAPGQPVSTQAPSQPPAPLAPEQAEFLRLRRTALSNQLESAQERRDEVAEQLRSDETQASERPGLEARLRVLDDRLVQIETEIALNGAQLANAPSRRADQIVGAPAGRAANRIIDRVNPNLLTIFGFALLMPFAVQIARRFFAPDRAPRGRNQLAETAEMTARMDKMESALDAVAIEVERIGESQRFLTQAMTDPVARGGAIGGGAFEGVQARERDAVEVRRT